MRLCSTMVIMRFQLMSLSDLFYRQYRGRESQQKPEKSICVRLPLTAKKSKNLKRKWSDQRKYRKYIQRITNGCSNHYFARAISILKNCPKLFLDRVLSASIRSWMVYLLCRSDTGILVERQTAESSKKHNCQWYCSNITKRSVFCLLGWRNVINKQPAKSLYLGMHYLCPSAYYPGIVAVGFTHILRTKS